jgi:hypothetical protein
MERYLLECLGTLRIQNANYRNKKALLLLAYLTLEPRVKGYSNEVLAETFFPHAENPKGSLSTAKWSLNQQLGNEDKKAEIVTKDYKVNGVVTDIELLLEACEKGESKLETIKTLFYHGQCFEGLELEIDDLSEELLEWIQYWREKVNSRVWEVLLDVAAKQGTKGHRLLEEAYKAAKTFPDHDVDFFYALLKIGGSHLTEIAAKEFGMKSPLSLEEAKALLEARQAREHSAASIHANTPQEKPQPELTIPLTASDSALSGFAAGVGNADDAGSSGVTTDKTEVPEIDPTQKAEFSEGSSAFYESSAKGSKPERQAILELIRNRFETARTSSSRAVQRRVVSKHLPLTRSELVWVVTVGIIILAVASQFLWGRPQS